MRRDGRGETIFPPDRDKGESWTARPVQPSVLTRLPTLALGDDDWERLHEALRVVRYLCPNCDITIEPRSMRNHSPAADVPAKEPSRSNRDKVLAVTKDVPATVGGIAKVTGLDPRKIRGVLTAPDLVFERTRAGKLVSYKFVATRERKRNKSAKRTAAANGEP